MHTVIGGFVYVATYISFLKVLDAFDEMWYCDHH